MPGAHPVGRPCPPGWIEWPGPVFVTLGGHARPRVDGHGQEPTISTEPPRRATSTDTATDASTDLAPVSAVLRNGPFRRLWLVFGLSSLGDWLGLLATSLFAAGQVTGSTAKGLAFGGVVVMRLLPAIVLGPLAGVFADRFDRRITMVVCDLLRFALFASIPLAALWLDGASVVTWALVATFLIEGVSLFWIPAKEAAVPNLVKSEQLEAANQLALLTTYGITPLLAVALGAGLEWALPLLVDNDLSRLVVGPNEIALYLNALTFGVAAAVVFTIRELSGGPASRQDHRPGGSPSFLRALLEGWSFVRRTRLVRGLVLGILGAFAAGGVVVGVGQFFAGSLSGGEATFYLLFGAAFAGLAVGITVGPRLVGSLSRHRWFGLSIMLAGASVTALAFAPHLSVAIALTVLMGIGTGMAYLSGTTLLGREVADEMRGRVFAFVQSMVRVVLMLAIALSSLLVGLIGSRMVTVGAVSVDVSASRVLLLVSGMLAVLAGVLSFRGMDDKPGVPVLADLLGSLRGRPLTVPERTAGRGRFVVFEGGEGAGKSTQARLLAGWLTERGYDVRATREPGATPLGARVRELLLEPGGEPPSARAEALLYAADRAHHVATVIRPALAEGAVVVCDRYVDSSLAYQGAGRALPADEVAWLSQWATAGLRPDLVILLDVDPRVGMARIGERGAADRLESESAEFHARVRRAFGDLAAAEPRRYAVLDAGLPADEIAARVRERLGPLLPPAPTPAPDATPMAGEPPVTDRSGGRHGHGTASSRAAERSEVAP